MIVYWTPNHRNLGCVCVYCLYNMVTYSHARLSARAATNIPVCALNHDKHMANIYLFTLICSESVRRLHADRCLASSHVGRWPVAGGRWPMAVRLFSYKRTFVLLSEPLFLFAVNNHKTPRSFVLVSSEQAVGRATSMGGTAVEKVTTVQQTGIGNVELTIPLPLRPALRGNSPQSYRTRTVHPNFTDNNRIFAPSVLSLLGVCPGRS